MNKRKLSQLEKKALDNCTQLITVINQAMRLNSTFIVYEMGGRYIAEVQREGFPIDLKIGASPIDAILNLELPTK